MKFIRTTIVGALFTLFIVSNSFAASIYETQINWVDMPARNALFAKAPAWQPETISAMFSAWQQPEHYQFPHLKHAWQQNILFINAFFGPINNPFMSATRPAKLFVTFGDTTQNSNDFLLVPLIQNAADQQYYVFADAQQKPVQVEQWLVAMQKAHFSSQEMFINVCSGYAARLSDDCEASTYQNEAQAIQNHWTAKLLPDARRGKYENWYEKVRQYHVTTHDSIYGNSVPWSRQNKSTILLAEIVSWPNYQIIKDSFVKIRDMRYFTDEKASGFLRRITWLYPDDGCWTRASAMAKDFFGPKDNLLNQLPRPAKLFVFGNLCVNTDNSPNGAVEWWYHTAPIVRDAETGKEYVLDPSINPNAPTLLEDWMELVAANTNQCADGKHSVHRFAICDGYATSPGESCATAKYQDELSSMLMQKYFRADERNRQVVLNRDVEKVLGDSPPWIK